MPTAMSLTGWSSEFTAARYQHVTGSLHSRLPAELRAGLAALAAPGTSNKTRTSSDQRAAPFQATMQLVAEAARVVSKRPLMKSMTA
jgi:hypothetical protein